jgi:hypothetical protein
MGRWKGLWLLILLLAGAQAVEKKSQKPKYHGPQCLGPFCFDRPITPTRVTETMGTARRKDNKYCIHTREGNVYLHLQIERQYYAPSGWSSELVLSDFANCVGKPGSSASTEALGWKTSESIGLGSSEEEVIQAYGKPSSAYSVTPVAMAGFVEGYDAKTSHLPIRGLKVVTYYVDDPITEGSFLIRDGKVAAIRLANPAE